MTTIVDWHAARNAAVVTAHADGMARFGLRPLTGPATALPPMVDRLRGGAVWAWQPASASPEDDTTPGGLRIGVAGRRLHLGHLSLARDVARLQGKGLAVSFVGRPTRTPEAATTARALIERIKQFGGREPTRIIDLDGREARNFEDRVLASLTLGRMQQVYGWTARTSTALLQDAVTMMAFFLYGAGERPSVALVDAGQMAHTALLRTVARRLGVPTPYVAYRRLLPDLRNTTGRASVHRPESTIFLDEPHDTVRAKFMTAVTGGRASAREQHCRGGDPTACPAFEVIELLCSPERAAAAARRCHSGEVLCQECKGQHADEVDAATRRQGESGMLLQAGTSTSVPTALHDVGRSLHQPPSRTSAALEEEIARYVGVAPDQVVVGAGTTEVLDWIMQEQASRRGAVLTMTPTFELYEQLAGRHGLHCESVVWDREGLRHDLGRLSATVSGEHTAVILDIPHAVSGTSVPLSDLVASVVPRLGGGAKLVIDNVYGEYMAHPITVTPQLLEERGELVVCRSLSKAHCLLGARVGYALTSAAYADRLRRHQLPYGVGSPATAATHAALQDRDNLRRNIAANRQAYTTLTAELDRLGIRYVPTDANFLLIDLGDRRDQVLAVLRACGLRFRDGARWQLTAMIQVHLIDEATVAPLVRALRALRALR